MEKETYTSRLSSKVVTSLEGQVTPPRNETPGKVAMGKDHDVGIVGFFWVLDRILSLFVESADFGDDAVDSSGHLCGRFSGGLTGRAARFEVSMSKHTYKERKGMGE